jgi:hypothetical protein
MQIIILISIHTDFQHDICHIINGMKFSLPEEQPPAGPELCLIDFLRKDFFC